MNIDPKSLAEKASAAVSAVVDKAKSSDALDNVKDKAGDVTGSLKGKAADVLAKGADMLDGLADKLKG